MRRSLPLLLVLCAAAGAVDNLAPRARITADSEYSRDWGPEFVADGVVPATGTHDKRQAWAVLGETHRQGATLTLAWPAPVTIAELVYYGRTSHTLDDCWRRVEVRVDDQREPVLVTDLKRAHGPQRLPLKAPVSARKLVLRFVGSFGGPNPGISELQVFGAPPRLSDLHLVPPYPVEIVLERLAAMEPYDGARLLRDQAESGPLPSELLAKAADWLDHPDPWVQAAAEWAIAVHVGHDNNGRDVVWPGREAPAWYQRWLAVPPARRVVFDWVRHAIVNGLDGDAGRLSADVTRLVTRGRQTAPLALPARRAEVTQALARLAVVEAAAAADLAAQRARWLDARRAVRTIALARRELDFDKLVFYTRFAPHHKPNVCGVHYSFAYKPGGDLCVLDDLRAPTAARGVLAGRLGPGHVHGMDLWFAGDRLVFGWASQPGWPPRDGAGRAYDLTHVQNNYAFELMKATQPVHLWEVDLAGGAPRQLTSDDYWSDLEPTWLPDGGIAFSSDRSGHAPSCDGWENDITDLNLYRLDPTRRLIRRLTNQKDIDMHPHLLANGLVGYLRWEYLERDFWDIHSFWVVRPDGTMADARFKQHLSAPFSVREVRDVPGSDSLVAIAAGHHCYPVGPLVRLTPGLGLNREQAIALVAQGSPPQEGRLAAEPATGGGVRDARGLYLTPYALSDDCYLTSFAFSHRFRRPVSHGKEDVLSNDAGLYLVDALGNKELLWRDPLLCAVNPLPLRARPRPPVLPDATDYRADHAVCAVPDVYEGLTGVARGEVRWIRILEALPWPVTKEAGSRYLGGASFSWQVTQEQVWNPVRVIGLVPVDPDGSAHFRVPTVNNASVYFQILDEHFMELRRMRTSISFQPGESRSCHGCHETRASAARTGRGTALSRPPVKPLPPTWGTRPLGYEWLVQPVLDRHCVQCHGGAKPDAGLDLRPTKVTFGLDTMLGSYFAVRRAKLVTCSTQRLNGAITKVKQFGSHRSRFITHLRSDAEHRALPLAPDEWLALVTWVDANCPYYDTLYNKRPTGGGKPQREMFPWRDPWAPAVEWRNEAGTKARDAGS
jgi:hypothetical protein